MIRRRVNRGLLAACAIAFVAGARVLAAQHLLVPMDDEQRNHLKAYGLTYAALQRGEKGEWLLNYRGGAFLLGDTPASRRRAALDGIAVAPIDDGTLTAIRGEMAGGNMDAVPLEKAPRIAIYTPPTAQPWDDAVTLALDYAGIPYTRIWDPQVLQGKLAEFEWLHLFHEDFTGQFNKFHISYRGTPWFVNQVNRATADARQLGFANVPALKKAVAERIRAYVENGGFLFAMCGASETLELALAGSGVDIANSFADGSPVDPEADRRLDWSRAFATQGARLEPNGLVNAMSDIDGHQVNVPGRRRPLGTFTLFAFSAKLDPVPTMLVQDHRFVLAAQAGDAHPGDRRRRAARQVRARYLRQGGLHVPRRPRPRGSAARSRRAADGSRPLSHLARLPADPQQRPVPVRAEEAAEDLTSAPAPRVDAVGRSALDCTNARARYREGLPHHAGRGQGDADDDPAGGWA